MSKALEKILIVVRNGNSCPSRSAHLLKVSCIVWVFDRRFPGHLRIPNVTPIKFSKPRMLFDILTVVTSPEAPLRIWVEKT